MQASELVMIEIFISRLIKFVSVVHIDSFLQQQIATATPPSPPATIEIHLQLFQHKQHKMDPQSHKITETLPISSDMSATDVIDSMVKKHGYSLYHSECSDNSGPANQSFYLKKVSHI